MPSTEKIIIRGDTAAKRALNRYRRGVVRDMNKILRMAAEIVRSDARQRFSSIDRRSAMGFRVRTRGFGVVSVEQRYRKTTGFHPEFGSLQMRRALLPAMKEHEEEVVFAFEKLLREKQAENLL